MFLNKPNCIADHLSHFFKFLLMILIEMYTLFVLKLAPSTLTKETIVTDLFYNGLSVGP